MKEAEFGWLHDSLAGQKGDMEKMLARQVVDEKSLLPDQWRKQTELYPQARLDPLMEKIKPLVTAGTFTPCPEGQWLHSALAGEKGDPEKALASSLIDQKSVTPGQWRAKTGYSYALKGDAVIDPANLPPAVDLALNDAVTMRLLRVNPGEFLMGSPRDEVGRRPNEPVSATVVVGKPYYIGIYEVTQAAYMAVMPRNPSFWRGNPSWPIDQVDWMAIAGNDGFLARLNRVLGSRNGGALVADLPSEEQWEYACRAGSEASFYNGRKIGDIDQRHGPGPAGQLQRRLQRLAEGRGARTFRTPGASTTCSAMSPSGARTATSGRVPGSPTRRAAAPQWRTQISAEASPSNQVGFRLVLHLKDSGVSPNSPE